jgi:DNA-binding PadR family transcriptional regulator
MNIPDESVRLSPSEKEALLFILKKGPTYAYNLSHNKTRLFNTEKTANTALNSLSRKSLLEKKDAEKERNRKYYYLTLKGLCTAMICSTESDEVWQEIESIIDRWGHLLPLFKKFYLFKKYGLEDYFKESFIQEARLSVLFQGLWLKNNADNILNDFIKRSMHRADADFMVKWNRVLHEDAELMQRTKWHLELEKRMKEQYLEELTERLSQVFPKLEQPNPDWDAIRLIELNLQQAHICDSGLVLVNGKVYYKTSNDAPSKP